MASVTCSICITVGLVRSQIIKGNEKLSRIVIVAHLINHLPLTTTEA